MPFQRGQSGNPAGRPKGSKDRRRLVFDALLPHGPELVAFAVKQAEEGDSAVLIKLLSLLIPAPKAVDREVRLEDFTGSLTERGEKVVQAIGVGQVTPSEGSVLLSALSSQARLVEFDDLLARLEKLESAVAQQT